MNRGAARHADARPTWAGAADAHLTAAQVAERLGMSHWFVRDHAEELGVVRFGRSLRFPVAAVEAYIARSAAGEQGMTSAVPRQSPRSRCRESRSSTGRRVPLLEPATTTRPESRAA